MIIRLNSGNTTFLDNTICLILGEDGLNLLSMKDFFQRADEWQEDAIYTPELW